MEDIAVGNLHRSLDYQVIIRFLGTFFLSSPTLVCIWKASAFLLLLDSQCVVKSIVYTGRAVALSQRSSTAQSTMTTNQNGERRGAVT